MTDYAPGMRAVIRDEEWLIKRIETNSLGHQVLHCVGVTPLVKDRDAIFLTDLEQIQIVDPASIQLIADSSPFFKRSLLYLESQWRQQLPTDTNLHIGHKAAMDPMPYQLDPAKSFFAASPPAHPDCGYCRPWQNAGSRYPDVGVDCTRQRQAHSGRHRKKHDDAVPKRNVESLYPSACAAGFQPNPKDSSQSAFQLQSFLLLR